MVKIEFLTPYYWYKITLLQVESSEDLELVYGYLKSNKLDDETVEEIKYNIENDYLDGGETNWNSSRKMIIAVFYKTTNNITRANIYSHEKRHIEDRILQHCKIDDMEAAAYLSGFLGEKFYQLWSKVEKAKKGE